MPRYLFQASYTVEGIRGLMKEGGSSRAAVIEGAVKSMGGSLDAFYFAFGESDVYAIAELPDEESAAAISLAATAAGAISVRTTVLIDPATMDAAVKRNVNYRPPQA